jgi:hypothetical protein
MQSLSSIARQLCFVAFASSLTIVTPQITKAAPDDTLGMAIMSADVNANGTIANGSGAVSATSSPSEYYVTFERSLLGCSCTATFGSYNPDIAGYNYTQSWIAAQCPFGDAMHKNQALVQMTMNGTTVTTAFHLMVFCPK